MHLNVNYYVCVVLTSSMGKHVRTIGYIDRDVDNYRRKLTTYSITKNKFVFQLHVFSIVAFLFAGSDRNFLPYFCKAEHQPCVY